MVAIVVILTTIKMLMVVPVVPADFVREISPILFDRVNS